MLSPTTVVPKNIATTWSGPSPGRFTGGYRCRGRNPRSLRAPTPANARPAVQTTYAVINAAVFPVR